jgi:hypothetical protein
MRKTVAALMVGLLLASVGCSNDKDSKKGGVEVKVDQKDKGGY